MVRATLAVALAGPGTLWQSNCRPGNHSQALLRDGTIGLQSNYLWKMHVYLFRSVKHVRKKARVVSLTML